MIELKSCAACGREKPLSAFTKRSGGAGRRGTCRTCLRQRKRDGAPPAEAGASAAEARAMAAAGEIGSALIAAASAGEEAAPALAGAPKRSRKRRRKKKQTDLRREDMQDDAECLALAGAAAERDESAMPGSPIEREQGLRAERRLTPNEPGRFEPSLETEPTAELGVGIDEAPPKRKRKRRGRRKKQTDVRRHDAADTGAAAASPSGVPAAATETPAATAAAAAAPLADGESDASPEPSDSAEGQAGHDPAAPRKRKRKRRRGGRGKSAKRKEQEAEEGTADAPSGPPVRPPHRSIVPVKGNFSFKTSLLNDRGRGMIRLRGKRETGKRWSTEIPMEMAVRMVEEGAAGIIHPGLIHKLYTKADFRLLVLQRDDYICRYCGNYGDTIDHVMPKSKGGLSTPANCVCACADCNLKKADSLDYVDDEVLQHFL